MVGRLVASSVWTLVVEMVVQSVVKKAARRVAS